MKIQIPEKANEIIATLAEAGYEAYVVGGCVRDAILGREAADWDITTNARPEQVKALFPRTVDTGLQHGTVTVLNGKEGFEVTTYRIDGEYLDGVNITGPDIYQRLHNGELPQTSLPRVEDFSAKLREIFDLGYDGVIAVMLSSGLSGTYNLARILAGECAEQGYAMKVFDSVSGALGQGMTVLQLAEDIKNGMGWEELTERRAPQLIANTYPFFSVDTLEYLVKGGRIGKVTAMAGTMLQIKPIITFAPDGQLQSVAKVRGRHQVMRKLVDMAVDRCGEHKRYNLAVAHGGAPEEMETVRQMLTEALPNSDHLWDGEIDGTLSVYIGDGVLGAAVQVLD